MTGDAQTAGPQGVGPQGLEVCNIWNANADFWDERMGDGNAFHKLLIEPAQLRLLDLQGGETILDLACGNGQFARKMADHGTQVVAVDGSERMIANARARSAEYAGRIDYRVADCTDEQQLLSLGPRQFNLVVCTMALMDIPDLQPLAAAVARLLKADGRFVFSLQHPCFNYELAKQGVEQHDRDGELVRDYYVRVSRYSRPSTSRGMAMDGQPVPHYYFHRPLATLLGTFFAAGLVIDGLEEPAFGANAEASKLFTMVYQEIPPALVVRMRHAT